MVMVSSGRSPSSSAIRRCNDSRSGLPGAYERTGSLTGWGTDDTASMVATPRCVLVAPPVLQKLKEEGQFLAGVPGQLVVLRVAEGELGVRVAEVGRVDHGGGRADGVLGLLGVQVHRRDDLERYRGIQPHHREVQVRSQGRTV